MAPVHQISRPGFSPCRRDLHATLEAFEEMIHSLDAVVWVADARTLQVLCVSRGAECLLGYPSTPAFSNPDLLRQHIHPDDRDRVLAEIRAHVAEGSPMRLEYRGVTAEGCDVLLRNHARLIGGCGSALRLLGIIVDVTDTVGTDTAGAVERAHAEAERVINEVREAEAARDRFLAAVVHELRNPIASMLAATEILRASSPDQARFSRAIQVMERSLHVQARLVEDLTELSAAMWGQMRLCRDVLDLREVVEDAVDAQRGAAQAASLSLAVELAPNLWVNGDRDRLQQAIVNLIVNAIKYTDAGGSVRVSLEAAGEGRVRVSVADTGMGISPELLETLFEIFRRGEATANTKPGLGIGLALVRSIAELHDGRAWAESGGLGQGSRFHLELPTIPAPA